MTYNEDQQPKLIIFDCDGTIIDSQNIIIRAMVMAFESSGLPTPTDDAVRGIIGLSLEEAVSTVADLPQQQNRELLPTLIEGYKQAFVALRNEAEHTEVMYPGAREVIEKLAGRDDVLLGIATGKSRLGLNVVLERENLAHHFHILKTADDAPSKPHPGMIDQAIVETGIFPDNTLMVGDTSYDMEMALNAGVAAIGVEWGYHDIGQMGHVGESAKDYPHLLDMVEQWLYIRGLAAG